MTQNRFSGSRLLLSNVPNSLAEKTPVLIPLATSCCVYRYLERRAGTSHASTLEFVEINASGVTLNEVYFDARFGP